MPNRANLSVPALFAGSLATAVILSPNWAVSATGECLRKPNLDANRAGHWYYYADRVHHRRCWFFEPSWVAVSPPQSPDRVVTQNADPEPSWFSRFAAGVAEALSPQPQQNIPLQYAPEESSTLDDSTIVARTVSPKHLRATKVTARERPQIVRRPETNGVASAERRDQLLPQRTVEKEAKHLPQLTDVDREMLFKGFLKWYTVKGIFGTP
jgi:hypothetical protein